MAETTTQTVSGWLAENIDSHGIYDVALLAELPEPVSYDLATSTVRAKVGEAFRTAKVWTQTLDDIDRTQGAVATGDIKGAYIDPAADRTVVAFSGYGLSATLDWLLTREDAGSQYNGRGFAYRANVEHLRAAGF